MKKLLSSVVMMLGILVSIAQNPTTTYTQQYGVDMNVKDTTIIYPWMKKTVSQMTVPVSVKGEYGEMYLPNPYIPLMKMGTRQRILLPEGTLHSTVSIVFKGHGRNQANAYVSLQGLNEAEEVVFTDTLSFIPDSIGNTVCGEVPLQGASLLDITIYTEGKKRKQALFVFSHLDIRIDGKPLDSYPVRRLPGGEQFVADSPLVSLDKDFEKRLTTLADFTAKKVWAIGESVHNHASVEGLARRFLLESARQLQGKLLFIEMHLSRSLFYNRYIRDRSIEFPEDYQESFQKDKALLDGLYALNANLPEADMVFLLGLDYNTSMFADSNIAMDLFDFVAHVNKKRMQPQADSLSVLLGDNKERGALDYLRNRKSALETLFSQEELMLMEYILDFSVRMDKDYANRRVLRDSVMAANVCHLQKLLAPLPEQKVILYAHAAHINNVSVYPSDDFRSAGNLLKAAYGDRYAPFLLTVGKGNVYATDEGLGIKAVRPLVAPWQESLEYALMQTGEEVCFLPLTEPFDCLTLSRFSGMYHNRASIFYPFNLYRRFEGVFYIDGEGTETTLPVLSAEERREQRLAPRQTRKQLLETIRLRCMATSHSK